MEVCQREPGVSEYITKVSAASNGRRQEGTVDSSGTCASDDIDVGSVPDSGQKAAIDGPDCFVGGANTRNRLV
jgi:hypothetical protein